MEMKLMILNSSAFSSSSSYLKSIKGEKKSIPCSFLHYSPSRYWIKSKMFLNGQGRQSGHGSRVSGVRYSSQSMLFLHRSSLLSNSCGYVIISSWYDLAAYQASLVNPWFIFWQDSQSSQNTHNKTKQTLYATEEYQKKVQLGIHHKQVWPNAHDISHIRSVTYSAFT